MALFTIKTTETNIDAPWLKEPIRLELVDVDEHTGPFFQCNHTNLPLVRLLVPLQYGKAQSAMSKTDIFMTLKKLMTAGAFVSARAFFVHRAAVLVVLVRTEHILMAAGAFDFVCATRPVLAAGVSCSSCVNLVFMAAGAFIVVSLKTNLMAAGAVVMCVFQFLLADRSRQICLRHFPYNRCIPRSPICTRQCFHAHSMQHTMRPCVTIRSYLAQYLGAVLCLATFDRRPYTIELC